MVIADDLTGANDTGVQFARQGLHTEVMLEGTTVPADIAAQIVVRDTNSRTVSSREAYAKVQEAAVQAHNAGFTHYYKKVDSTLRGNLGVELQAILDLNFHDFAFVMPAFPQNGRTTVGGQHLLQGVPLAATEIARDPKSPVTESSLPELLRQQTSLAVGHIGIAELLGGEDRIAEAIRRHLRSGCRIVSCDAWLKEHFLLAAWAVQAVSNRIVWTGSAGLAECLPELFGWKKEYVNGLPVLAVAGSVSSVTRGQVQALLTDGYQLVEVDLAEGLSGGQQEQATCVKEALANLAAGKNVVLASGYHAESVEQAKRMGAQRGMSSFEVSDAIAKFLGKAGALILERQEVAGVILTGGDTAVSVCKELGVTGIRVLEEVVTGIPLGEMKTSAGKGLRVITKAGAFGNPDGLVKATRRLQQKEVKE